MMGIAALWSTRLVIIEYDGNVLCVNLAFGSSKGGSRTDIKGARSSLLLILGQERDCLFCPSVMLCHGRCRFIVGLNGYRARANGNHKRLDGKGVVYTDKTRVMED